MNKQELLKAYREGLISKIQYGQKLVEIESMPKEKKQQKKRLPKSIKPEEFVSLIKAIPEKDKESRVAFLLAYASGLRISEIVGAKRKDGTEIPPVTKEKIDFNRNTITVYGKYKVERIVPLPKGWRDWMTEILPIEKSIRTLERNLKKYAKKAELNPEYVFHCVSEDTEILTLEGWKNMHQIKRNDCIFSYNLEKDLIEKDKVSKINVYNHDGDMIQFKNSYLDCLMTENHRDLLNIAHIKHINQKRVSSIWDGWKLLELKDLLVMKNKRLIKKRISGIYNGHNSIGEYKAGILGWILSDGNIHKRNKGFEITISQSFSANKYKCDIISNLLLKSGLEYSIKLQKVKKNSFNGKDYQMMIFRILSSSQKWIFDFIEEDRTPKWNILSLMKEELEQIYKMLMLGDGCRNKEYCSQNKKRIEFMQILCTLINKRCLLSKGKHNFTGKDKHRTWISNHNEINMLPSHISKIKYKGIVWCPSTKNKTWIARRNNRVFITGNSLRHSFATRSIEAGIPISHVQNLMGHSNVATTSVYLKARPEDALKSYQELF